MQLINVKPFQIVSILVSIVSLLFLTHIVYGAIQFYGADVNLDSAGNAKVKLTMTFLEPVSGFTLPVFGTIKNFETASNAGPQDCVVTSGAASIIVCKLNLTQEKRTLELQFETADFVKSVDGKSLLSLDLSLNQRIDQTAASVRLPEAYALTKTSAIPSVSPPTNSIVSDGRRIIVNWNIANITTDQSLKLQTLYEPIGNEFPTSFIILGIASFLVLGGLGTFFYRRIKKPKEIILSVLDDFERKVVEVITVAGGEINQRKVVAETNLSKAKVSRVVKRLQERGLIEVTRLGRTNKLKLAQKKFEGT